MRRRLQGIKHTDCTDRKIFGRRNRYASTAQTVTGTPVVDNEPASRATKSGDGGPFPFYHTDAEDRVFLGGSASTFNISSAKTSANHFSEGSICPPPHNPVRRSFTKGYVFESTDRIAVYNYLCQSLSTQRGPAAQSGAAECDPSFAQRRSVTPFSDLSCNSRNIAEVSQLAEINRYATSAVQFGAAELCNSVLYLLPIHSIMELLAVKNCTLDDPKLRLRRVIPFSSLGFVPTSFPYARLSLLGIGPQGRSGVRAFLFHDETERSLR